MSQDPEKAANLAAVREALAAMSGDEYRDAISRLSPDLDGGEDPEDEDLREAGWPGHRTEDLERSTPLVDADVILSGYLASALTDLKPTDRQFVFQLSHAVGSVCEKHKIDLYEPRNISDPVHHSHLPDWEVWKIDRDRVLSSDVLIHLAHFPSTGSGEELSFAYEAMVPIIVVSHAEHRVSRMVTGIPGMIFSVTYQQPEELTQQLSELLVRIRPVLLQRRAAMEPYASTTVGHRIRAVREARNLTIDDLAAASQKRIPIDARMLEVWESATDQESNLSLLHLRELSVLLGISASELIEPSPESAAIAYLERYVHIQAARGHQAASAEDLRELRRSILARLAENLDI